MVQVEIERSDAVSSFKQRDNDVHGKGGFASAALLVSYDDDVRRRLHAREGTTELRITRSSQLWKENERLPEPSIGPEIVTVHSHIAELTN